jgi:hypothetical protein
VDEDDPRRTSRRFRTPQPGDEVDLRLSSELERELVPATTAARVQELRRGGIDRLRVRVVKAPRIDVLAARDAVKVEAPELAGDTGYPTVYVRLESLDLPAI